MSIRKAIIFAAFILAVLTTVIAASSEEAAEITKQCKMTASNGGAYKMTDGKTDTYWQAKDTESMITIELPKGMSASGMLIEWFVKFDSFEYAQFDSSGTLISQQDSNEYFHGHVTWLDIDKNTVSIKLKVFKSGRICGLHIYSFGEFSDSIQRWEKPSDKIDLMLIVAHQDDEELWFGGLLPYYSVVRDSDVQVIYMTSCGRARIREALNGLWIMGVKAIPEVVGFKNSYTNVKESTELWGGKQNIERALVREIRKYRPEVIVTHDLKGEYGHPQHKLIAMRIVDAVIAAADPDKYPDSANIYGAWEVKKVYLHLSNTQTIYMDWEMPSDKLGGKTPLEMAELGYQQHKSQLKRYNMSMGKKYDYTKFGLVYSTVGEDINKNDFLENTIAAN